MIKTTYICDCCRREVLKENLYTITLNVDKNGFSFNHIQNWCQNCLRAYQVFNKWKYIELCPPENPLPTFEDFFREFVFQITRNQGK